MSKHQRTVIMGMLAALVLSGTLLQASAPVSAGAPSPARASVLLAPAFVEGKPMRDARGCYHRATLTVDAGDGAVWLAAHPDGSGDLRTDDQAELVVRRPDGALRIWSHDFRDPASGAVRAIGPQDLSALFTRGRHTLTFVLRDILPPAHSSTSYYLIYTPAAPAAGATPGATVKPAATMTPAALPTDRSQRFPTTTPFAPTRIHARIAASATPTILATGGASGTDHTGGVVLPESGAPDPAGPDPVALAVVGAVAVLLVAMVIFIRRRRRVPADALFGIASVYDRATGESCERVDLTRYRHAVAVMASPLRIAPASGAGAALAILCKEGRTMCCRVTTAEGAPSVPLRDMDELHIGNHVVLEFRAPASNNAPDPRPATGRQER